MPIVEFTNLNKYGHKRTRRFYQEKSNLSIDPSGFGPFIAYRLFKYDAECNLPPTVANINGKTYIMPIWKEVIEGTTVNDIEWIKPKPKVVVKQEPVIETHTSSSSADKTYKTVYYPDSGKFYCDCPGRWRAFDNRCKHIKELEKKVK